MYDAQGCADHIGKRRGKKRDEPVRLVCQGVGGRQGKGLQRICKVLVADSAFSKRPFIDKVLEMGFHVVSRLRHDAALFYTWDGEPTGNPGRPRVKGDKIDVRNIDMSKVEMLELEETSGKAYALKAWCKSLHRVVSLVIHELPNGVRRLTSLRMRT